MRAAVLRGIGETVRVETVEDPRPGPGEVVVRIRAAALNHRDVWIRRGQYAGLKFPIILGSDGVGEVEAFGEGVENKWEDKPVILNASLGWGPSEASQDAKTFRILGLPDDGTFAELVKVPAENVHVKPDHLSEHEAAALPLAGLTAYRAVFSRGDLKPNQRVLVTGAGGGAAGFAVQFATAVSAETYVTSSDPEKIKSARNLGAIDGANYKEPDWDQGLRQLVPEGFDLIVDSAGGEGFSKLIDLAAPGGRIVFFGATTGNPSELNMRKVFWKQLSLVGTTMGSPSDFLGMLDLVASKHIRPVVDSVFPLEQANEAFGHMERGAQSGKILLEVK